MSSPDKLIYMANQIATFFRSQPGTDQPARVAAHIKDFWEPRMRLQLFRIVDGTEKVDIEIDPFVRRAAETLKEMA
jgi:formate dehydrogenase subunit delta